MWLNGAKLNDTSGGKIHVLESIADNLHSNEWTYRTPNFSNPIDDGSPSLPLHVYKASRGWSNVTSPYTMFNPPACARRKLHVCKWHSAAQRYIIPYPATIIHFSLRSCIPPDLYCPLAISNEQFAKNDPERQNNRPPAAKFLCPILREARTFSREPRRRQSIIVPSRIFDAHAWRKPHIDARASNCRALRSRARAAPPAKFNGRFAQCVAGRLDFGDNVRVRGEVTAMTGIEGKRQSRLYVARKRRLAESDTAAAGARTRGSPLYARVRCMYDTRVRTYGERCFRCNCAAGDCAARMRLENDWDAALACSARGGLESIEPSLRLVRLRGRGGLDAVNVRMAQGR